MLAPLDVSVQHISHNHYPQLLSPDIELNGGRSPFLPQATADSLSGGVVRYQTAGAAQPAATFPLSPISPAAWAAHPCPPSPWSFPNDKLNFQCPPPTQLNGAPATTFAKDPPQGEAISLSSTHEVGPFITLSNEATGYLSSPPAQYFPTPTYNHDSRRCDPPEPLPPPALPPPAGTWLDPESASANSHTGLVSPCRSLIGQQGSTTVFGREERGPDPLLVARQQDSQDPGLTTPTSLSVYYQGPSPTTTSPSHSAGSICSGGGNAGDNIPRGNSTPISPRSGKTTLCNKRSRPSQSQAYPQTLKSNSNSKTKEKSNITGTTCGDSTTTQTAVDKNSTSTRTRTRSKHKTEKEKRDHIRAYHREVGARNRQKEKEERARFELQTQELEKVNAELVAEEKSLATQKLLLVNELFCHYSQCNISNGNGNGSGSGSSDGATHSHRDLDEYLAVESLKM